MAKNKKLIKNNDIKIQDSYIRSVVRCLKSGWIANGSEVKKLEDNFKRYHNLADCCAVNSGTAALYLALKFLKPENHSLIGIPSYTCSSLLNVIFSLGHRPLIFDIDSDSFLANFNKAKDCDVMIPVHTFGNKFNLGKIKNKIIEDCSHITDNNLDRNCNLKTFSFYASKPIFGGHGGLIGGPKSIISEIRDYINFDSRKKYKPRFNFLLSDINASLINAQIDKIEFIKKRKKKMYSFLKEYIPVGWRLQKGINNNSVAYKLVLRAPSLSEKNIFIKKFKELNIETSIPIKKFELLHNYLNLDKNLFPNSEMVSKLTVSIPFHNALTNNELNHIKKALLYFK